jgi:hypothetical protein
MAVDLIHGDRAGGLADAAVGALGAAFRGKLSRPGEDRYDDARRVWNGMTTGAALLVAGSLLTGEPPVLPQRPATWADRVTTASADR